MKKMLFGIVIVLVLSVVLSGCLEKLILEGKGTIVYNDFEGGFYGIISDESYYGYNKFNPNNLPSEFKQDGLRVKFKARVLWNAYSYHMWGIVVKILEIERLDSI